MLKFNASMLKLVPLVFLSMNKLSSPTAEPLDDKKFEYHHKQEGLENSQHSFSQFD